MIEKVLLLTGKKNDDAQHIQNIDLTPETIIGNLTVKALGNRRYIITGIDLDRGDQIEICNSELDTTRNFTRRLRLKNFFEYHPHTLNVSIKSGQFLRIKTQTVQDKIVATFPW